MIILNLQRIANYKSLKHWALIISVAFYGWGTKDTVGNVTSFLGITVSRRTRDDFFKELTADRVQMYQRLLTSNRTGLMVRDNFQRGQELRDQRGGRSSKFLIGTVEAAHRVIPFHHFQWDGRNIIMRYDREQSRPSPFGMRAYESLDPSSETFGTDVCMNHANLYVPDCQCFTGDRVRGYEYGDGD
jgi:hypothetical protein